MTAQPSAPEFQPTLAERAAAALPHVTRRLVGHARPDPADEMRALADEIAAQPDPSSWDIYGSGGPVERLEDEVAALLGLPAAAFFPSGIMAQQAALRVWTDRQGSRRVAIPELSHLLRHELDGPSLLHGLRYEWLTSGARVPTVTDLEAIPGPLGAAVLELPLREGGYLLPTWEELVGFAKACRERGVPLHLDGARLWESTPHLGHDLATVAGLADSVYVSFYKGLGGLGGAVLAGPQDVVEEAAQWRRRLGGTLFTLLPLAVSGLRGLRTELPRMPDYHTRAVDLAERLTTLGIRVHPAVPHTNAFQLWAEGRPEQFGERLVEIMERDATVLLSGVRGSEVPGWSWCEFVVGSATMEWDVDEAAEAIASALRP